MSKLTRCSERFVSAYALLNVMDHWMCTNVRRVVYARHRRIFPSIMEEYSLHRSAVVSVLLKDEEKMKRKKGNKKTRKSM